MMMKVSVFLCILVASVTVVNCASRHPSAVAAVAPAPAVDCLNLLYDMSDCLTYVSKGGIDTKPEGDCCSGLKTVLKTKPECICELFKQGASYGIDLNFTRALALPADCGGISSPPLSECGLSLTPSGTLTPSAAPANTPKAPTPKNAPSPPKPSESLAPISPGKAPSPPESSESPASSPSESSESPASSPPESSESPASSPPELSESPASSPPEPSDSPASSPPEPSDSPASSPPEPSDSPASSPPEPSDSPASSPPEPSESPASSPPEPSESPAPVPSSTGTPASAPDGSKTASKKNVASSGPSASVLIPFAALTVSLIVVSSSYF